MNEHIKNYLYLWRALAEDGLLNLDPVFGNTTPIWKPERPPWWKGDYKSGFDISKKKIEEEDISLFRPQNSNLDLVVVKLSFEKRREHKW